MDVQQYNTLQSFTVLSLNYLNTKLRWKQWCETKKNDGNLNSTLDVPGQIFNIFSRAISEGDTKSSSVAHIKCI